MKDVINPVHACSDCAAGIANDDWTHLDDGDDGDDAMVRIESMLELYGWLTHVATVDLGGYYDCDVCWDTNIGTAELFSAEKDNR